MTGVGDVSVLIAGAGPTGLMMACELARRGVSFRIVDKAPEYFNGSRGKGLQPRTLEVMDDLGVIDRILELGRFHLPFRGYEGGKAIGEQDIHAGRYPTPSTPYASPLIIPQWRVEETLRGLMERLSTDRSGRVELGLELVGLEQDDAGVTATLRSGDGSEEVVRSRYLVACDGGKSFVRKQLGIPFEGETWKDERMYVADVSVTGLDREAWHAWTKHPDGFFTLCPLPSTDQYQFQAAVPVGSEEEPSLELFQRIAAERTEGMPIAITTCSWMSLFRANVRMVERYREGRVFLAGDAAHVHTPAGGQGMNTGIQDAYNLGWKMAAVLEGAPEALLDTYEEERLPVAAAVLGVSSKLYKQIAASGNAGGLRDATTLQLGITYSAMSLSRTAGGALKIVAGDRAPDAPGERVDGSPVRLFDLYRGVHWTLVRLFGAGSWAVDEMDGVRFVDVVTQNSVGGAASGIAEVFVDIGGHVAEAYGGSGEWMLVRPDGYLGWVGSAGDLEDLKAYLKRVSA
ncbi:MAG TPA: FAD-dependent oxidoreductase [Acidobacteriaceae bacterium]|nr:FAD-dependent oxidoreductase [Acidobacteriaceae bacterium]